VFHDNDALMSKHDVTQTAGCMRLCGWTKTTHSACIYLVQGRRIIQLYFRNLTAVIITQFSSKVTFLMKQRPASTGASENLFSGKVDQSLTVYYSFSDIPTRQYSCESNLHERSGLVDLDQDSPCDLYVRGFECFSRYMDSQMPLPAVTVLVTVPP
jgi:hypothetical protein